jgi:hypothetical protein
MEGSDASTGILKPPISPYPFKPACPKSTHLPETLVLFGSASRPLIRPSLTILDSLRMSHLWPRKHQVSPT